MYDEKNQTCYDVSSGSGSYGFVDGLREQKLRRALGIFRSSWNLGKRNRRRDGGERNGRNLRRREGTAGTLDNRTEPDTTHEGVMKGIADDVKNGVNDIKEDVKDMTEPMTTTGATNR